MEKFGSMLAEQRVFNEIFGVDLMPANEGMHEVPHRDELGLELAVGDRYAGDVPGASPPAGE